VRVCEVDVSGQVVYSQILRRDEAVADLVAYVAAIQPRAANPLLLLLDRGPVDAAVDAVKRNPDGLVQAGRVLGDGGVRAFVRRQLDDAKLRRKIELKYLANDAKREVGKPGFWLRRAAAHQS
jgi:hypothetical protein